MEFSAFGRRYARHTGALELMEDLGAAMARGGVHMLGGGNPAQIPELEAVFRAEMAQVLDDPVRSRRMLGNYASPGGEDRFREALAALLKAQYGWELGPANIALTSGSQTGFFQLFNLLAGEMPDGSRRRILLPLTPEYIGYSDTGVSEGMFSARRPEIELLDDRLFKYRVDFDALQPGSDTAAICVSRPTNPTGNVLTDDEMSRLSAIARARELPLIIDNAYGLPFPRIVFSEINLHWDENTILCMSLSKIGLPAVRCGIVIAREEIVQALTGMNAVMSLAVPSVGPVLLERLLASGELLRLSREVIRPFYQARAERAVAWVDESLQGCDYRIHRPEGALFLWLWFPGLPISSQVLYERLKARGVLVLSGHHFFPGLEDDDWRHKQECIRVTYSQDEATVREGIRIIGEEVRAAAG
ncbi:MAG: valine--pyruvate transaminase [Gammaproteobacteria bacterium]|nr:valine--pyruvate transaminase [Gammaproteobacteria bacterium]TVQ48326.1 MAG: valine--pyruvate transaminase [Gammaproteobacteria bacterium]